jgi:hypothetical protein
MARRSECRTIGRGDKVNGSTQTPGLGITLTRVRISISVRQDRFDPTMRRFRLRDYKLW